MTEFYDNGKTVIGFLVIVLVFSMAFGEDATGKMVLLVLLGMVLINSNKFIGFLETFNQKG